MVVGHRLTSVVIVYAKDLIRNQDSCVLKFADLIVPDQILAKCGESKILCKNRFIWDYCGHEVNAEAS